MHPLKIINVMNLEKTNSSLIVIYSYNETMKSSGSSGLIVGKKIYFCGLSRISIELVFSNDILSNASKSFLNLFLVNITFLYSLKTPV